VAFRKKLYRTIAELQSDLDAWLAEYNQERRIKAFFNGVRPVGCSMIRGGAAVISASPRP
jgi:hypothetical protein